MSLRVFGTAPHQDSSIVFDPASGTVRLAPMPLPSGRYRLKETEVRPWPTVESRHLAREKPVSLCWSPLVRCNLACPHCLDDKSLPELRAARRAAIGRLIGASGVLGVDISGGEPLLMRNLPQLAGKLAEDGVAVSVTTNGWHLARLTRDLAGSVDAVRVSLDGPNPASHDALRGDGSFTRAVQGITAASAANIPVQIHTVLMASTLAHAQRVVDLAHGLGARGVTFLQMLPIGEGSHMAPVEMLTDETAEAALAELTVPDGVEIRLRRRASAENFTVVRADGTVWRNGPGALAIAPIRPLIHPDDLALAPAGERS
jgi:MoaA/NifB/PqqE/SkfB family radical SAM enzyme